MRSQLEPDVEVIFEFVGDRKRKLFEDYRPAHLIGENYLTTGIHSYYNLDDGYDKGLRGTITFISPEVYPASLRVGEKIPIYEGRTRVGYATITNIFNSILSKNGESFCRNEENKNESKFVESNDR